MGERVSLFREPDAGNLPVRFDEREQETESGPTGLRRTKRKLRPIATGRLKPLRLFSTLLRITLIDQEAEVVCKSITSVVPEEEVGPL